MPRSIGHGQPVTRGDVRVGGLLPQAPHAARSQDDGIGLNGDDGLSVLVEAPNTGDPVFGMAVSALNQIDGQGVGFSAMPGC